MQIPNGKSIILFDGYCYLCSWTVRTILRFDKNKVFLFTSLSSESGAFWKEKCHLPELVNSVILVETDACYIHSAAVLKIAEKLGGGFRLLKIFQIIPLRWRDLVYKWIAKNRIRWFGKRNTCMLPKEEDRKRFI